VIDGNTAWWLTGTRIGDTDTWNFAAAIPMHLCDIPYNAQAYTVNPLAAFTWTKRPSLDAVNICVLPKELTSHD
jgi:hypothetical protein